jgi:hypothetical protein
MSSIIAAEWSVQQSNVGDIHRPAPLFRLLRKKQQKVDRPQYIKKKVLSSSYLEESFFLFDK